MSIPEYLADELNEVRNQYPNISYQEMLEKLRNGKNKDIWEKYISEMAKGFKTKVENKNTKIQKENINKGFKKVYLEYFEKFHDSRYSDALMYYDIKREDVKKLLEEEFNIINNNNGIDDEEKMLLIMKGPNANAWSKVFEAIGDIEEKKQTKKLMDLTNNHHQELKEEENRRYKLLEERSLKKEESKKRKKLVARIIALILAAITFLTIAAVGKSKIEKAKIEKNLIKQFEQIYEDGAKPFIYTSAEDGAPENINWDEMIKDYEKIKNEPGKYLDSKEQEIMLGAQLYEQKYHPSSPEFSDQVGEQLFGKTTQEYLKDDNKYYENYSDIAAAKDLVDEIYESQKGVR